MIILDGKILADKIKEDLKLEVNKIKSSGQDIKLAIVMIGDNDSSLIYIKNKKKICDELDINYEEYLLDSNTSLDNLKEVIEKLNKRKDISGILLQSPLPKSINEEDAFNLIDPNKDIDGLTKENMERFKLGEECFIPCTPLGIIRLIEEYKIEAKDKNIVIIGRSNIVGKPLALLFKNMGGNVTICHSQTEDLKSITVKADILVSAVGKAKLITSDMVKENSIIIDVGINKDQNNKTVGDVDFYNVSDKVSYITKVPGGVGPMTVIMLISNLIKAVTNKE